MSKPEFDIKYVTEWQAPAEIEAPDAHIICMPNVPKPIQGPGCQPRTILGKSTWDHMRKRCYFLAGYKCECCGREVGKDIEKRQLAAHELFSYDFKAGTARFKQCVALCHLCHTQGGVHSGRAYTMYKKGNPFMTAEMVLEGAEHAFSLVHKWNTEHPDEEPLRLYATWIEFAKDKRIGEDICKLIEKYDVKFYAPDPKKQAPWGDWKLFIGNKEYPTPYADEQEWEKKMEELNRTQTDNPRNFKDPFSGGVFDEIKEVLKSS